MPLVLAWYIITELGSILENAVKMGAKVPEWLVRLLKASAELMESAGDAAAGEPVADPNPGRIHHDMDDKCDQRQDIVATGFYKA